VSRRRITLVNQFFPPSAAPTAHLAASLAEHLAERGDVVTVIGGRSGYLGSGGRSRHRRRHGEVRVICLWTSALGKGSIVRRLFDYVSFLVGATVRLALLRRQDVVISLTTPPFVVVSALAHKALHRRTRVLLWSMDCYPDVIENLGSRTEGGPVVHVGPESRRQRAVARLRDALRPIASPRRGGPMSVALRGLNRAVFARLDHLVALDEAMRYLLLAGYGSPDRQRPAASVIPNWERAEDHSAGAEIVPWGGYADDALRDRFVVLYLGNLGYGHHVETVTAAAGRLGPDERVAWLFVGGGVRWEQLEGQAASEGAGDRVVQREYVDKSETPAVMAGADCALIVLADEALGLMSPSKLHANLAAGLPIVYIGPAGSNVDEAITRFACGVSLRTGDVDGLVATVCRLRDDDGWRAELSANARRAFDEAYSDRAALPQWDEVLDA